MSSYIISAILKHIKPQEAFDQEGIKRYRAFLEKSAKAFRPDKQVGFEPIDTDGIKGAWITPPDLSSGKTILYLHGGGFIAGSIRTHRDLASRIAKASCARLFTVDYRLVPEHPFPAALNDALAAYKGLLNRGTNPGQVVVGGDSAGGGLALSLLVKLGRGKLPLPQRAVFLSPWVDLENKNPSIHVNRGKDPMLTPTMLDESARLYTEGDLSDPLVSPINADFDGLCPVLIHVGENEILLDDALLLARNARESGVEVEVEVWDEMFHVFQYFARYLPAARQAVEKIGRFTAA